MLSLDAFLISSLLAMPLAPVQAPPAPEPPAQPEPAPEPAQDPEPQAEPSADEPSDEPAEGQSERERQLEEELAEARARTTELERMVEELRQQVTRLRQELAARPVAAAPAPPARRDPPPAANQSQGRDDAPEAADAASAPSPPRRSWEDDPAEPRRAPAPPPAPALPPTPVAAVTDPDSFLSSIRASYAARFPSIPDPAQRDAFDAFAGDVVKWSASQQRTLRLPVTWSVNFVRVEKGSSKDRTVRLIARRARPDGSRGTGDTFVVRILRSDAEELLKGDYRHGTYEVTGTLAPIVRFAPERPYDGISSTHSAFVGPFCEMSIALDSQSIRPGT